MSLLKKLNILCIVVITLFAFSCAVNMESRGGQSELKNTKSNPVIPEKGALNAALAGSWNLVWSDEFEYTGLPDSSKWGYDVGGSGWGNNELQYYTANRLENSRVENGKLIITCRNESWGGKNYTSARMVTKNKGDWLYGRVEVRAKLPTGKGTWPAIWMLPTDWEYGGWPASGELDIMEHVGYDQNTIHQTIHTDAYNHTKGTQKSGTKYVSTASSEFHTYSMEWFPEKVDFFIDNDLVFTFNNEYRTYAEWPFDKRFHLILNIAFGGDWGGAMGIDPASLPQSMEVEYVRVYELGASDALTVPGTIEAEAFTSQNGVLTENCSEGGQNVGWIDTGDTMTYRVNVTEAGTYKAEYRVAGWASGSLELKAGNNLLDSAAIPYTGNYQAWTTAAGGGSFTLSAGEQDLTIAAAGPGWNINWFKLTKVQGGSEVITVEAEAYSAMYGVQVEDCSEGGQNVGWVDSGDWMDYRITVNSGGTYKVEYRVAGWQNGAAVQMLVDAAISGTTAIPNTGAYQAWTTVESQVTLTPGTHTIRLQVPGPGWNINWFKLTKI